jgi:hypothetical protein
MSLNGCKPKKLEVTPQPHVYTSTERSTFKKKYIKLSKQLDPKQAVELIYTFFINSPPNMDPFPFYKEIFAPQLFDAYLAAQGRPEIEPLGYLPLWHSPAVPKRISSIAAIQLDKQSAVVKVTLDYDEPHYVFVSLRKIGKSWRIHDTLSKHQSLQQTLGVVYEE